MILTESQYRVLIGQDPENDNQRLNLAGLCFESERWREAEGLYREVADKHPDCTRAVNGLARLYIRTGRLGEASELIKEAFRRGVDRSHELLYSAGLIQLHLGNMPEAERCFKRALAALPADEPAEAEEIRQRLEEAARLARLPLPPFSGGSEAA